MPGSNNFSTYDGVFSGNLVPLQTLEPTDDVKLVPEQRTDSSSWISPGLTYLAARNQGYNRRTSRLIAGKDKFIEGIRNDNPDFDYVRRNLRNQGLTRRATKRAMKDPQFWANIRKTYGQPQTPTAQPLDQNEAALRDKMDREALAHEQAGDIYNAETNTWTPKPAATVPVQTQQVQEPEIAQDDLRGISSFNQAFAEARRRGLKQFSWGNKGMIYGTQLASKKPAVVNKPATLTVTSASSTQLAPIIMSKQYYKSMIDKGFTWNTKKLMWDNPPKKATTTPQAKPATLTKPTTQKSTTAAPEKEEPNAFVRFLGWLDDQVGKNPNNRNKKIMPHSYYLKGGKFDDSLKQFIAYLIQVSGAQTEQELTDFIQSLGEDGLKLEYQNFVNIMQQGEITSAKNGAKLNYIKSLRGKCPEGYELGYFKEGGHICAKCVEKREKQGAIPFKPIQGEKGTKVVQDFKKDLKGKKDKITLPKKQTEKKELGGIITIKPEFLEAFKCGGKMKKENGGLVKKDKKVPIKELFINKDKCGGKAKKKKK